MGIRTIARLGDSSVVSELKAGLFLRFGNYRNLDAHRPIFKRSKEQGVWRAGEVVGQ